MAQPKKDLNKLHSKNSIIKQIEENEGVEYIDERTGEITLLSRQTSTIHAEGAVIIATKKSLPYEHFTVVNHCIVELLVSQQSSTVKAALVLFCLINNRNKVQITKRKLANACQLSDKTLDEAIDVLRALDYLQTLRDNNGQSYTYYINPKIVFRGRGKYYSQAVNSYEDYKNVIE